MRMHSWLRGVESRKCLLRRCVSIESRLRRTVRRKSWRCECLRFCLLERSSYFFCEHLERILRCLLSEKTWSSNLRSSTEWIWSLVKQIHLRLRSHMRSRGRRMLFKACKWVRFWFLLKSLKRIRSCVELRLLSVLGMHGRHLILLWLENSCIRIINWFGSSCCIKLS